MPIAVFLIQTNVSLAKLLFSFEVTVTSVSLPSFVLTIINVFGFFNINQRSPCRHCRTSIIITTLEEHTTEVVSGARERERDHVFIGNQREQLQKEPAQVPTCRKRAVSGAISNQTQEEETRLPLAAPPTHPFDHSAPVKDSFSSPRRGLAA